jgi:hypothetical protein
MYKRNLETAVLLRFSIYMPLEDPEVGYTQLLGLALKELFQSL